MTSERPNTARIRYDRDALHAVITDWLDISDEGVNLILDDYEKIRTGGSDSACQSKVHHGPGHQSSTYCQNVGGPEHHDVSDGSSYYNGTPSGTIIHSASLPSGGYAEWTDDDPYTRGY